MATGTAVAHPEEATPLLRMTRHHQALSWCARQRQREFRRGRRRSAHPLRGERRRQEHAHAYSLRPLPPRRGRIQIKGRHVGISSPAAAIRNGIGMIHQHFMLVDTLTVAENVALGLKSYTRPPHRSLQSRRPAEGTRRTARARGRSSTPSSGSSRSASANESRSSRLCIATSRPARARRADRSPHAARGRRPVPRPSPARCLWAWVVFISHKVDEVLELSTASPCCEAAQVGTLPAQRHPASRLVELMVGRTSSLSDIQPSPRQLPAS